ncbi:MAG: hypothetical protein A2X86_14055 [Bdellovibrionales bacterium GWA2_49_15]|nr:MAG: hypothetical protein A2X86_14055 [Bdellovibrionales bacterium GWA2_49_15]
MIRYVSTTSFLVLIFYSVLASQAWAAFDGKKLFTDNCADCHTIGGGATVGPDLHDLLKRRNQDWAIHYIEEPDELRERKDPIALELKKQFGDSEMPNVGLNHEEVEAVVAYLAKASEGAAPEVQAPVEVKGDIARGRDLFIGSTRFAGGGPACFACHAIADRSNPLGGNYALDLTPTAKRLGPAALLKAMQEIPFPTMKPIYRDHALTDQEQNDLAAYLLKISTTPDDGVDSSGNSFVLTSVGIFLAVMILFNFIWAGRLRGVRKPMVKKGVM